MNGLSTMGLIVSGRLRLMRPIDESRHRLGYPPMKLWILALIAVVTLLLLLAIGFWLFQLEATSRRLARRRALVVLPYAQNKAKPQSIARLSVALPTASIVRKVRSFAGMDPARRDPYPVRFLFILPPALLCGWIVRWLLHGLVGQAAWLLMPMVTCYTIRSVYIGFNNRRSATLYRQFPDALATIVRAVRVGIPVTEAIRAVAQDAERPTSTEFGRLHDQVGIGAPLEEALQELAARNHLPEYRFFATALSLQSQTGGGLTETLENLADVVRKRVALKARGYALAAEARTSAAILALLPVFTTVGLMILKPEYISPLLEEGLGQTLFGGGVVWLGIGILVMRGLIQRALK